MSGRNNNTEMYQRITVPRHYLASSTPELTQSNIAIQDLTDTVTPPSNYMDSFIFFICIFLREFVSTICLLVLNSRLGGDLFIAGPIVTLYVSIVFRRPLNNPFVTTLACISSGDWKNANVAGYPGFDKQKTGMYKMIPYLAFLLIAQLLGALTAAHIRAYNDKSLGHEFIKGASWGSSQIHIKVADMTDTCWKSDYFPPGTDEIPVHLYKDNTEKMFKDEGCISRVQWRWWMFEDFGATLFLLVAYVHVWRWLRWEDTKSNNPRPSTKEYWEEIISFSTASAGLGLMTAIAFPTAHAGLHTSVFLATYQSLTSDRSITANTLGEPLYRALGGAVGCICAVMYENVVAMLIDPVENIDKSFYNNLMHKMLYYSPIPVKTTE